MLKQKDRLLLDELQFNFPLCKYPFRELAKRLKTTEKDIIKRIKGLMKSGVINYISGAFDLKQIGFKSTLIAMKVPASKIKKVASIINKYPEVTHNYLRTDKYNLWFTLSAGSSPRLEEIKRMIIKQTLINDYLDLSTEKVFKIDTRFKL